MVENYDLCTLFGVIDEKEFVSECINLVVDEDIKEIIGNCMVVETIGNHGIENYYGKNYW